MTQEKPLPAWLRWGIPVLLMLFSLACEVIVPDARKPGFFSEDGPHEAVQAIWMVVGFVVACLLTWKVPSLWLKLWFGIAALSCLYVGGEEISWGQSIFSWATPASWGLVNDQNETNLHNTSAWLDQKPKIILQIGVLVGGLIIPALQRWSPSRLPARFAAIYPTSQLSIAAGLALSVKLIETVQDRIDEHLFWRASEVLELFIYYFVMLYLLEMWARFKRVPE